MGEYKRHSTSDTEEYNGSFQDDVHEDYFKNQLNNSSHYLGHFIPFVIVGLILEPSVLRMLIDVGS